MNALRSQLVAKDVMTSNPICATRDTRIRELGRMFEEHEVSGVPVVDSDGTVIGIVTKTDLIRRCSEGTSEIPPAYLFEILGEQDQEEQSPVIPEALICVEDFMTDDPVIVRPDIPVSAIAKIMFEKRIHRVVVVDEDKYPVGVITSLDLLRVFPS